MNRILIIEDDHGLIELWRRYFSPLGMTVESATTLREGMILASKPPPVDFVVLDLVLPDSRNAEETLRNAVQMLSKINHDVVIFVATGITAEKIAEVAALVGADGFSYKTCLKSQRALLSAVQLTLDSRRASARGLAESGLRLLEKVDELLRKG